MTTAQVVETSVTVNNNSPIPDYVHPDDQTQPTWIELNWREIANMAKRKVRTFAPIIALSTLIL